MCVSRWLESSRPGTERRPASVEYGLVVLPVGHRRVDRPDVELEAAAVLRGRGPQALGHHVAAHALEDQRERHARGIAGAGPGRRLDPREPQAAVPTGEAELLVHMRSEVLM